MPGFRPLFSFAVLFLGSSAFAQLPPSAGDWANMQQDVRELTQRVGELSIRVEQLERENNELKSRASTHPTTESVTPVQLNQALAAIDSQIRTAVASSRTDILQQVGTQMEKLARQTNAALDSLAKNVGAAGSVTHASAPPPPQAPAAAGAEPPREGTRYVVQKGDTIGSIAKKTGGRVQDIISANKLTDPSRIMVGQALVIPSGK